MIKFQKNTVVEIKSKEKFYITTAIPYVNAEPHVGHALEFVQTDAIKRYQQLLGKSTFLVTGSDENSLKNVQAAMKEDITTQKLCDKYSEKFRETMKVLNLSFDIFMRSSSKEHFNGSQKLWNLCKKDIYKKKYKGLYCIGCETFYTESELENGKCPEHKTVPESIEEENYFFRLSKYQKQLEKLIETGKLKIVPESRKNEVLAFINQGLEDFSVSRSKERTKGWGVPVPHDDSQIIFVWFDALNIYQTGVGFGFDEKLYKKLWPCDMHVIGKGIIRFHAVYWPAILLAAKLKVPKSLFVHGYITINGEKISKSVGNVINPLIMAEKYGTDQLRYYMIRDISPFNDGDFSEKSLVERVNQELVSNYSNLFYRVTSFIENNFGGIVPKAEKDEGIQKIIKEKTGQFRKKMTNLRLNEALECAISLSGEGNSYFQHKKPWETVKTNKNDCAATLYNSANVLAAVSSLLYPFIPDSSKKALDALGISKLSFKAKVNAGTKIKAIKLFENIELKQETKKPQSALNIVTATIKSVQDHPNAEKLYVLGVDLGNEQRQLVAGLKGIYSKEEMEGKQILILTNLKPAKLRGVESNGMLLACEDGTLIAPEKRTGNGVVIVRGRGEISIDDFVKQGMCIGKNNTVLLHGNALKAGSVAIMPEKKQKEGTKIR